MHLIFVFSFLLISYSLQASSTYTPCPPGTTLSTDVTSNTTHPTPFSLLVISAHLARNSDPSKLFMLQSSSATSPQKDTQQSKLDFPILDEANEAGIELSLADGVLMYDGKFLDRVVEEEGDERTEVKELYFWELEEGERLKEGGSEERMSRTKWEIVSCGREEVSAQFLAVSAGLGEGWLVAMRHEVGGRIVVDLKGDSSEAVYLGIVDSPEEVEKEDGGAVATDSVDLKDTEVEELRSEKLKVEDTGKEGTPDEDTQTMEAVDGTGNSAARFKDEL